MLYTNVLFMSELLDFEHGDFAKGRYGGEETFLSGSMRTCRAMNFSLSRQTTLLGASLTRSGHAVEGEALLRTALTNFNPVKRALFLVYGNAETALGDCLLAQKRYAEAEPLLLKGYDELRKRWGEPDPMSQAAAQRLEALYTSWNKPGQAKQFAGQATPVPSGSP